ncbi:hypothetical protein FACS1894140_2470 [Spirochaetia bacterium]|nr:hypothetical protein FACS1894140_2470 [Spirochaetia bacterium]
MNPVFDGALALRRRNFWEAADAGLLLWRRDFFYFLPFFAIPFCVCAFALRMLPENIRPWSIFILWFLKPLFDRPALHVIGVRFFEPQAASARLLRGLGGYLLRGLPGDLLWRRFSPWRSAMMPVRVLEGLKPAHVRQRKRLLSNGGIDFCVLITIWGNILEDILLVGETLFLLMVIELMQDNYITFTSILDFFAGKELFFFIVYCVNYILIESLYVCMGFGLYINSRVEVEGWDLEVLFRSFLKDSPQPVRSNPEKNSGKKKISAAGVLALCLFLFLLVPADAYAETGTADTIPFEILEDIISSKDFGGEKESWGIRFRRRQEEKPRPEINIAPWVDMIKEIFAVSLRAFLVLAVLGLMVFSIIHIYRLRAHGGGPFKKRIQAAGLSPDSGSESPEQLLEQARSLYAQTQLREAWAACFAAALSAWSQYRSLFFPPNTTEYGCVALIRGMVPAVNTDEAAGFAELVRAWVAFAYGGKIPADAAFDKALAFCESLGAHSE